MHFTECTWYIYKHIQIYICEMLGVCMHPLYVLSCLQTVHVRIAGYIMRKSPWPEVINMSHVQMLVLHKDARENTYLFRMLQCPWADPGLQLWKEGQCLALLACGRQSSLGWTAHKSKN